MDVKGASERLTRWRQGLAQSPVPEAQRQPYSQAVERFLSHIGEDPLKITSIKARQFMAEVIQKQLLGAPQVATWKEALNWFFGWWHAAAAPPPSRDVPPLAASDLGRTDWENQLISVIRRRHFSWRTEETYRGWAVRFARFLGPRPVREAGENEAKALPGPFGGSPTGFGLNPTASAQRDRVFVARGIGKEPGRFQRFYESVPATPLTRGERHGHPDGAGFAGTCGYSNHPDIFARNQEAGDRGTEPLDG